MTRTRERASETLLEPKSAKKSKRDGEPSSASKKRDKGDDSKKMKKEKKDKKEKKEKKKEVKRRSPPPPPAKTEDDGSESSDWQSSDSEKSDDDDARRKTKRDDSSDDDELDDDDEDDDASESNSSSSENADADAEEDVSAEFRRARSALRAALDRYGGVECFDEEARESLKKAGLDDAMDKVCKDLGMQVGAVIKKMLRKNLSLMGARDNLLETSLSLEDDLRPRAAVSQIVDNLDPANFQCRMWDSVAKHNNVVFGRAQAAIDSLENATTPAEGQKEGEEETEFAKMYRDAFIEAYGDDIETLRKDEKTNVGVILRTIQSGVDIVPQIQKQLHLQWATLNAREGK